MRLLMVSGDRQVTVGERGPFHAMQAEFSGHFERIDVLCPRPPRAPTVTCIHENVHFHPAPCGRAGMASWVARRGHELVGAHGHALIVSHDYGCFYNGIGSARISRATGVPYVSEIHHVPGVPVAADAREVLDRWLARRYVRWATSRARAFRVVNAIEMPRLLASWGVPPERILVLPSLYIDLELFSPAPDAPLEQDVVFVGRMVANKGLLRLAEALALLHRRGLPARALFVGRGPLRQRLERRIAELGLGFACRFVDWLAGPEDLAEAYRRSRVVVCASTCEGGPRVTVEGMACGVPPVSTRVGVMGEIVRQGENGRLVDFTAGGLADGLEAVLADEDARRAMGRAARRSVLRFEKARVIAGYARGLQELVGAPAAA